MATWDAIVLGLGGMGSAAICHLARRGLKVLGLEQFDIAHDRGSSHGQTRLIRKAYFEHPDYVPLVEKAYILWAQLEESVSRKLLHRCGLVLAGKPDGTVMAGVRRAADEHRLPIECLSPDESAKRFPGLVFDPDMQVLFEPASGFLEVENCVRAHCDLARTFGATLTTGRRVLDWSADSSGVTVVADDGRYLARNLVICGGAWSGSLLAAMGLPLTVRRKVVLWFAAEDAAYRYERGCPVFGFDRPEGFFYGFPAIDELGVKVSDHYGGQVVSHPTALDRDVHLNEETPLRRFLEHHAPRLGTRVTRRSVCMYTMTPDEHFIVDRHPRHANVVYACGFSGHGFKFAPVIGSVLADLVADGRTAHPVGFLRADRSRIAAGR